NDRPAGNVNFEDLALPQRHIVEVVARNTLPAGQISRLQTVPHRSAVGQTQCAYTVLADDNRLVAKDAGKIQIRVVLRRLPQLRTIAQVDAMDGTGVRRGEDHLAIDDDRRRHFPVAVTQGEGVVGDVGELLE